MTSIKQEPARPATLPEINLREEMAKDINQITMKINTIQNHIHENSLNKDWEKFEPCSTAIDNLRSLKWEILEKYYSIQEKLTTLERLNSRSSH